MWSGKGTAEELPPCVLTAAPFSGGSEPQGDGNCQSRAGKLKKEEKKKVQSSSETVCISGKIQGKLKDRETIRRTVKVGTRELCRQEQCSIKQCKLHHTLYVYLPSYITYSYITCCRHIYTCNY